MPWFDCLFKFAENKEKVAMWQSDIRVRALPEDDVCWDIL
jgi:hypothetical protein